MWSRIFGKNSAEPPPEGLRQRAEAVGGPIAVDLRGDDRGWTAAEIRIGDGTPVYLERYLRELDDIRPDLNSWAAWLETLTYSPNAAALMERVIQCEQLITLRRPIDHADDSRLDDVCTAICQWLAGVTEGFYMVDDDGWYEADGTLLVKEY